VVSITKDSMSTGEPYMETATSDEVRAKCGDPREILPWLSAGSMTPRRKRRTLLDELLLSRPVRS